MSVEKHRPIRSYVLRQGRMTNAQKQSISQYWDQYGLMPDQAVDWQTLFDNPQQCIVEVGFGMGDSLLEQASQNPQDAFVGIEVHQPGVGSLLGRLNEQVVNNVKVYCHDAVEVIQSCMPQQSIDRFQLFFPDPWTKAKHHKRRIVQPKFVQLVVEKLKIGGVVHFATDWEHYAEYMLSVLEQEKNLKNCAANNRYVERPKMRPLTKFEQRGQKLGHAIWDLMFEKVS